MNPTTLPLRLLIWAYQWLISPLIPGHCRFLPSCSHYAAEAIDRHGALAGTWLALKRIGRCHPWGAAGYDPVPKIAPPKVGAAEPRR